MGKIRRSKPVGECSAFLVHVFPKLISRLAVVLMAGSLLSLSSCASDQTVDYSSYEKIPLTGTAKLLRTLVKSTPATKRLALYGNYGGPGNGGGVPMDDMDELFRRHDLVYHLARTRSTMRLADQELVAGLKELEEGALDEPALGFRERSIKFFESSISVLIGKPFCTLCFSTEKEGSHFEDPDRVSLFFSKGHSGLPGDLPLVPCPPKGEK